MIASPEKKKRRIALLHRETQITLEHCNHCDRNVIDHTVVRQEICGDCPFYKELRQIGGQLSPSFSDHEQGWYRKRISEGRPTKMTFTKEDYEGWLSKGMSGHDIGKMLGFSQTGVARRYRKLKKQAQE